MRQPRRNHLVTLLIVIGGLFALTDCAKQAQPPTSGAAAHPNGSAVRLVSLSPAVSSTLARLGAADLIVGRTPWCAAAPDDVPVVGTLNDFDAERLVRLDPTHLLVQPPAAGLDPDLAALAQQHGWTIRTWSINTIPDIRTLIRDLPTLLPPDDPRRAALDSAAADQIARIDDALTPPSAADRWTQPTLFLFGDTPLGAFGTDTYLHDIWTALGGVNATTTSGWIADLSLEDVVRMNPAAVIRVTSGAAGPDPLGPLATLEIDAAHDGRAATLAHPEAMLPSAGVADVAAALREIMRTFAHEANAP